ncbi:MAG: sugar phosphate isomerase/epimerase family protein [Lachnospiraceae bacterium]|nr:sugar phosphate isomerase/epimerase family protein [Lachnospiraceae bacterium]
MNTEKQAEKKIKKVYLSHLLKDTDLKEITDRTGCGLESIEFSIADNLDRLSETICSYEKRMEAMNCHDLILHGPFLDLNPMAFDSMVLNATKIRYEQCYQAAKALGAKKIVYHTCYIPKLYLLIGWAERVIDFWNHFLDGKEGIQVVMENVQDPEIEPILQVAEQVAHPDFGLCLDIGHAHCYSNYEVGKWTETLGGHIKHVHLHDNDGSWDSHLALGDGTIEIEKILSDIRTSTPEATCTIECSTRERVEKSIEWMKRHQIV